jgi:hypothetical protein
MEVEVSLKRIKDGTKYGTNKKIEDCKKAWHVSVSKENVARGHDMLKKACARRNPRRPLFGIQRLVPLYGTATTDKEEQFVAKAQARQFAFMSQSATIASTSISKLDTPFVTKSRKSTTLRHIVANIKRSDQPHVNLFMEVGYAARTQQTSVIFLCAPIVRAQAQLCVNSLIPYCRHFYGDNSLQSFHASSVADMHDVTWDLELNKAVSPRDKILEDADKIDADAGFDLDEIADSEVQRDLIDTDGMEDANKAAVTSKLMTGNEDNDTLGSFQKVNDNNSTAKEQEFMSNESIVSNDTCDTTGTSKEKISNLEKQLSSLLGTTDDSNENLTKAQRIAKVTHGIEQLKAKQDTAKSSSNKEAAAKANAEDVVSVSSASSDSSSESEDSSDSDDENPDNEILDDAASDSDVGGPAFRSTHKA